MATLLAAACDSPSGVRAGPRPESDPSHPGALSTSGPVLTPPSRLSGAQQAGPWAGHAQRLSTNAAAPYVVPRPYYILWQNKSTGDRVLWRMIGTQRDGDAIMLPHEDPVWDMAAIADFTGDGDPEILFQNRATGNRGMWSLKGTTWDRWIQLYGEKPEWDFATAADFTGDGQPDVVLQNTVTGQRGFWWMHHDAYYNWLAATTEQTSWRMVAAADFTGDGQNDIVFQNEQTGQRGVWVMNGSAYAGWRDFYVEQPVWDIAAAHDADGDGKPDLLFQNRQTGLRGWALMDGTRYRSWVTLGVVAPEWDIVGTFRLPSTAPAVVTTDSAKRAHAEPTGQTNFPTVTSDFYGTVSVDATTTFQTFIEFSRDSAFAYPYRATVTPTQVGPDVFLVHAHEHVASTYYRAGAVTAKGTVLGPVQFFRYPLPPQGPPVTVSVDPVTLQIRLSWTSTDSGAVTVYRTATSQDAVGGALGMGPHEAVDSTFPVDVSRTYRYFTQICDDAIQCGPNSPLSDPVASPVLARPTNLQMTSTGDSTLHVTLTWSDNAPNERGYFAFYSPGANDSFFYFNGGRMYPPNTTTATYTNGNTSYSPHQMRAYVVAVASGGRWSLPSDTAVITVPGIP